MAEDRGMRATNCRVLTKNELDFVNNKYIFWLENDKVAVKCKNIRKVTYHSKNDKFAINIHGLRKITYGTLAITMFECFQNDEKTKHFTLTDIQNAINICYLTYQLIDNAQIINILNKEI